MEKSKAVEIKHYKEQILDHVLELDLLELISVGVRLPVESRHLKNTRVKNTCIMLVF